MLQQKIFLNWFTIINTFKINTTKTKQRANKYNTYSYIIMQRELHNYFSLLLQACIIDILQMNNTSRVTHNS